VSFHESLWAATSAAAPAIVIAVVIALPDVTTVLNWTTRQGGGRLETGYSDEEGEGTPRRAEVGTESAGLTRKPGYSPGFMQKLAGLIWLLTVLNLIIQAGLLAVSLSALAARQDVMPTPVAIVLAVGGILLLAWTTAMTARGRRFMAGNLTRSAFLRQSHYQLDRYFHYVHRLLRRP
jgi:hypothetical protein